VGCWICQHQVVSTGGEAVGTCSQCWIHACDTHGERLSGAKFQCAIETAQVLYADLVVSSPAAAPVGASALRGGPLGLQSDVTIAGWNPNSRLWQRTARHRAYWRERIERVLRRASGDHFSPWFGREFPDDRLALTQLADLVGLVAWYLGLGPRVPYPSTATAGEFMRAGHTSPADLDNEDPWPYPDNGFPGLDPSVLAWLFERLRITPAEVVYLLRYYADTEEPYELASDWGLGPLHDRLLQDPFLG
jgi:hypothetical protein